MKPALIVAVALLAAILAGCNSRDSGPTQDEGGHWLLDYVAAEPDLLLIRGPAHATLRAYHDETTKGAHYNEEECASTATSNYDGRITAYLKIWNRTGLAVYQAKLFDLDDGEPFMDFTVDLPGDPPYLIAGGAYCFDTVGFSLEITAQDGGLDAENLDIHPPRPDALLVGGERRGSVTVPALQTEGVGSLRVGPEVTEIQLGFLPGDTDKMGGTEGVFEAYEPNGTPGQDHWFARQEFSLGQNTEWWLDRYFAAMPGDYPLRLTLPRPFPMDTTWSTLLGVREFTPKVKELGFQQPFRDYTHCEGQATHASGLLDCSA
jgi:hypothetical protein